MAEARWMAAMRRGDFAAAYQVSDEVLARRDKGAADDPRLPYHLRWVWDGRTLAGRDVLVRCYHGLGDTLQFARFLPDLAAIAASVTLEVQPELLSLLAGISGVDRMVAFRTDAPLKPAECDIEIMELAHALRLEAVGGRVPYLAVPSVCRDKRADVEIGLCWRAGNWDPARSVPRLRLEQACDIDGVALRDLTVYPPTADVLSTAVLVEALDLIVTVDTMIAHLAGALGRPTWLLLKRDCDWRWMDEGCCSPGYPTMRLYRQEVAGDWSAPLEQLRADLRLMVAAN